MKGKQKSKSSAKNNSAKERATNLKVKSGRGKGGKFYVVRKSVYEDLKNKAVNYDTTSEAPERKPFTVKKMHFIYFKIDGRVYQFKRSSKEE